MEILVVVMIILVIAAIAIPNMLQARVRANEAAAVASMNTINAAEAIYVNTYPQVGFAGNLADLGSHGSACETIGKSNSCIIRDEALTGGLKGGYTFELVGDGKIPDVSYTLTAAPESPGTSGRCTYTSDESGQILTNTVNSSQSARSSGGTIVCQAL